MYKLNVHGENIMKKKKTKHCCKPSADKIR